MSEWVSAWLNVPEWVTHKEGYKTKWASTLNTETNRSFWHKDGPLIGFIWVHLLSGRLGTHPRDPSLFTHPPLHRHVPLCLPPMIPTQPCLIMAGYYHDNRNNGGARDKRVCVGHRDSLSTCETAEWKKKQTQLWVFLFWELLHKDVCYFCSEKFCQRSVFWMPSLKTLHLEESDVCLVTNPEKMRFTCAAADSELCST